MAKQKKPRDIPERLSFALTGPSEDNINALLAQHLQEDLPVERVIENVDRVLEAFKGFSIAGKEAYELTALLNIGKTYETFGGLRKALQTYEVCLELSERLSDRAFKAGA